MPIAHMSDVAGPVLGGEVAVFALEVIWDIPSLKGIFGGLLGNWSRLYWDDKLAWRRGKHIQ